LSNGIGVYVTTRTYASIYDQWAGFARPLITSSKTKPCQFSSVTSLSLRPYRMMLNADTNSYSIVKCQLLALHIARVQRRHWNSASSNECHATALAN